MKPLKSQYGSVKPYTRHEADCPHKAKANYNDCRCAKWLYVNQRGAMPKRYSLKTPSWSEAVAEAGKVLDGLNPEIAQAREQKEKATKAALGKKTIEDAVQMWLARTEHKYGKGGTWRHYSTFFPALVRYVDRWNHAKGEVERIRFIDELDARFCEKWYESWKYANTAMRQRWNVVRSFFNYLHQQGVIQSNPVIAIKAVPRERTFHNVPFTDQQYNDILNYICELDDRGAQTSDGDVYRQRLEIFIELLRWTGMDIGDAVQFRPSMVDGDGVLRYIRTKTEIQAVVVLEPHMVELLKEIPLAPNSVENMPFRYQGNDLASDVNNWSRRIRRSMDLAGVTEVQLVEKSGLPAVDRSGNPVMKSTNVKMFRHTFAVGCLVAGIPKENVARMLGHVSTEMIDAHYAPWVKGLDDAHIRKVREVMTKVKLKKGLRVVSSRGVRVAAAAR